jgi:hypothetical protein
MTSIPFQKGSEEGRINRETFLAQQILLDHVPHGRYTMDNEVQVLLSLDNKPQVHKLDHMYQITHYYSFKFRYSYQFKVRKVKIKSKVVPVF